MRSLKLPAVPDRSINSAEPNISTMLRSRIDSGDFPSAVYVIAENGRPISADALGDAVREPERRPATLETIYDLASLTKPLVTGLLCAQLVELGELTLDSSVANYLLEFDRPDKSRITIRELLTHTAGLPAWRPLYLLAVEKESALASIANEKLDAQPGEREDADDGQRENENGCEDRTFDTKLGKPLHESTFMATLKGSPYTSPSWRP